MNIYGLGKTGNKSPTIPLVLRNKQKNAQKLILISINACEKKINTNRNLSKRKRSEAKEFFKNRNRVSGCPRNVYRHNCKPPVLLLNIAVIRASHYLLPPCQQSTCPCNQVQGDRSNYLKKWCLNLLSEFGILFGAGTEQYSDSSDISNNEVSVYLFPRSSRRNRWVGHIVTCRCVSMGTCYPAYRFLSPIIAPCKYSLIKLSSRLTNPNDPSISDQRARSELNGGFCAVQSTETTQICVHINLTNTMALPIDTYKSR